MRIRRSPIGIFGAVGALALLTACGRTGFEGPGLGTDRCSRVCDDPGVTDTDSLLHPVWDAETGDLSQWGSVHDANIVPGNQSTVSVTREVVYRGAYAFKFDVANDPWTYGCFVMDDWASRADLHVRFYLYLPTPTAFTLRPDWRGRVYLSNVGHIFGFQVDATGLPYRWAMQAKIGANLWGEAGATVYYSTANFSLDTWHAVEIRMMSKRTNGGVELWVDGAKVISESGLDFTGEGTNGSAYLGAVYWTNDGGTFPDQTPNGEYAFYIDSVKIDDAPIGPLPCCL